MKSTTMAALAALALLAAGCSADRVTTQAGASSSGGSDGTGTGMGNPNAVPGSEEDLKANVGDRVLFDFNHATVTDQGRSVLDRQAAWLAKFGSVNVQIAGNCDERGTEEYNIVLGQRRANVARDYLVAKGVATARMSTTSFGKDRPVALGSNEASWMQNRNAITSVQ